MAALKLLSAAADPDRMRSVVGLCATVGMILGGYIPGLWGASSFSLVSVVSGGAGAVAGIWFGARLQS